MRGLLPGTAAATLTFLVAFSARADEHVGNAVAGRQIALDICAACHAVGQQSEPILKPPAPPFRDIANEPDASFASLKAFLITTHAKVSSSPTMPNPFLTDDRLADVVSYILSFRDHR